jgi:gluconokinase
LKGDYPLIRQRLARRAGHFMGEVMLASQFDALEEPEHAVVVDSADPPEVIVDEIMRTIGLPRTP